jgi:hypothetical protein
MYKIDGHDIVKFPPEPAIVTIPRKLCSLTFSQQECSIFEPNVLMPTTTEIIEASKPKPLVLVVKMGVSSPFEGDRRNILTKVVRDVAQHGGVQLVFLTDRSEWTKGSHQHEAADAFPAEFAPLICGYTENDIQKSFPTKADVTRIELPSRVKARAISKYYETYSWSWWWLKHGKSTKVKRIWVIEDDTVFSGDWAKLLEVLESGLNMLDNADLISFRDYCTPEKSWVWARWMHEGWSNLTFPGQVLGLGQG